MGRWRTRQGAALAAWLAVWTIALTAERDQPRARPGRPAPSAPAERRVPFGPGEVLEYDVSWSSLMTAGTATISVRAKRRSYDSVAYYIVAEGRPVSVLASLYRLYYKADTLLDAYTLLPQRGSLYSEEGRRRRMRETRFDQRGRSAVYEVSGEGAAPQRLALRTGTHDPLSAIFALRALPLRRGLRVSMPVSDAGRLYQVEVAVTTRESLPTPLGPRTAWRLVPSVAGGGQPVDARELVIWISDDDRRLPLRMDAQMPVGAFRLMLREARS